MSRSLLSIKELRKVLSSLTSDLNYGESSSSTGSPRLHAGCGSCLFLLC